jgi:hypothetical protein
MAILALLGPHGHLRHGDAPCHGLEHVLVTSPAFLSTCLCCCVAIVGFAAFASLLCAQPEETLRAIGSHIDADASQSWAVGVPLIAFGPQADPYALDYHATVRPPPLRPPQPV